MAVGTMTTEPFNPMFLLLLIPLFLFLGTIVYLLGSTAPTARPELGQAWFLTMMVAIAAGVPLAFYVRGKAFFYGFWSGRTVTPHQYIYGSLVVWTVIEAIGILSLVGCLVSGDLAPNLVPALIAFVVFVTQWPNATALYKNTGNRDDSSEFVHPR